MIVRKAVIADSIAVADLLDRLLEEIMEAIGERAFELDRAATDQRIRNYLTNGDYFIFVAEHDAAIVGFGSIYESRSLYANGSFGTIPELFVLPKHRSSGVGNALLAAIKNFAKERGWHRLEVTTPPLPQFERTLAFYERDGFQVSGGRKLKWDY